MEGLDLNLLITECVCIYTLKNYVFECMKIYKDKYIFIHTQQKKVKQIIHSSALTYWETVHGIISLYSICSG